MRAIGVRGAPTAVSALACTARDGGSGTSAGRIGIVAGAIATSPPGMAPAATRVPPAERPAALACRAAARAAARDARMDLTGAATAGGAAVDSAPDGVDGGVATVAMATVTGGAAAFS